MIGERTFAFAAKRIESVSAKFDVLVVDTIFERSSVAVLVNDGDFRSAIAVADTDINAVHTTSGDILNIDGISLVSQIAEQIAHLPVLIVKAVVENSVRIGAGSIHSDRTVARGLTAIGAGSSVSSDSDGVEFLFDRNVLSESTTGNGIDSKYGI